MHDMTTTTKRKPMCDICRKPTWVCSCGKQGVPKTAKIKRVRKPYCAECGMDPCGCSDFVCGSCRKEIRDCVCENGFDDPEFIGEDENMREMDRLEAELLGQDNAEDEQAAATPDWTPRPLYPKRKMPKQPTPQAAPRAPAFTSKPVGSGVMPPNSLFLTTLALAHRKHEGWYPGSLAQRNNNPGNLRFIGQPGATMGEKNFARFPSYNAGFQALMHDLWSKLTGRSRSSGSIHTLLDYVRVYAPVDDGNSPDSYTAALVGELNKAGYPVTAQTPLSTLASYI